MGACLPRPDLQVPLCVKALIVADKVSHTRLG